MPLLQSDRNAALLVDVLRANMAAGRFRVRDFVIMPNHVHLLLTLDGTTTVEKAVQLIKGGFSYRLKKETGYPGEVWQGGFSDARVHDEASLAHYRRYIAENPVRAGLVQPPDLYRWSFEYLRRQKRERVQRRPQRSGEMPRETASDQGFIPTVS